MFSLRLSFENLGSRRATFRDTAAPVARARPAFPRVPLGGDVTGCGTCGTTFLPSGGEYREAMRAALGLRQKRQPRGQWPRALPAGELRIK